MLEARDERLVSIFGRRELDRLRLSVTAIVGVGMLGGRIALELGTLGVPLILIDPGLVEPANLGNQQFPAASVGRPKVEVRAEQIRALNPLAEVEAIEACVEAVGLGVFARAALVCGGLDGRAARVYLGRTSQRMQIPWLDTAVDGGGQRLHGTVALFDPSAPAAPCAACKYPDAVLAEIRTEARGPGCPSFTDTRAPATPPTLMAAPFGNVVVGHALAWAVDVLLGRGAAYANTQLRLSGGAKPRAETATLARSPHCRGPHEPLAAAQRVPAGTLGALWRAARETLGGTPDCLLLCDRTFVTDFACTTCREAPRPHPPLLVGATADAHVRAIAAAPQFCRCPPGARVAPARVASRFTAEDIRKFRNVYWSDIGLPSEDVVTAQRGERQAHFIVGLEPATAMKESA